MQVRALDNVLDLTHWPLPQQREQAMAKRRIGVGFTGLGDALVMLGLRYDEERGRNMAAHIARSMRDAAYLASVELAREKGPFPAFDADGYLFLTGRLKEQINRGGEKISPLEVDEVLLRHPSVAEAVTFAIPHDKLGEDVGAAVVLAAGHEATEAELRDYLRDRLAAFKVPSRIEIYGEELPRNASGKIMKRHLRDAILARRKNAG